MANTQLHLLALSLRTIAIFFLPAAALMACLICIRKRYDAAAESPFTDQPLRFAGDSARKKADELLDSASDWLLAFLFGCLALGVVCALSPGSRLPLMAPVFLTVAALFSLFLLFPIANHGTGA
jgi:hypothetical protein